MSLWWGEIKFVDFRFPPLGFRPRRMGEREEKEGRGEEGEENFPWRNQKRFGIEMMELVGFEPTAFRMQSGRATTALKPLEQAVLSSFSFSLLLFPLPPLFSLFPLSLSPLFLFFLPSFDPPLPLCFCE